MKLATYDDGSRDGQLVVVSRDLASAHYATGIATRLQSVLDDWNFLSPQLQDLYATLNHGKPRHAFEFEPHRCRAPLPRAFQWVRPTADPRGGEDLHREPLMRHAASDEFAGPCDDIVPPQDANGVQVQVQVQPRLAVVTGDVAAGSSAESALEGVRLLMLAHEVLLCDGPSLATPFAPVAVTPDELGEAWQAGRVHLTMTLTRGRQASRIDVAAAMQWPFGELLAHHCRTRPLRAGAIVGSQVLEPSAHAPLASTPSGKSRRQNAVDDPADASAPARVRLGDTLRIDLAGPDGISVFGTIAQRVRALADMAAELHSEGEAEVAADAQRVAASAPPTPHD